MVKSLDIEEIGVEKKEKVKSSRKEKVNVVNIYFRGKHCGINAVVKGLFQE